MNARCGMSLVEVLIAAFLLALGLAPVGYMFFTAMHETEMDRMELEATGLANELIEQVRSMAEGRIGVPMMYEVPPANRFPDYPKWVDIDAEYAALGRGFPLLMAGDRTIEASRMYIRRPVPGYHRWLQIIRPSLVQGDVLLTSPFLLEVRARVDYGSLSDDASRTRHVALDTLMNHEDVSLPR